ncbi:MAG: HamA C-terminal domain-containing protein [Deltaproteobacteria bacterium]
MNATEVTTKLRDDGVESWLVDAIQRLARADGRSLDPYLLTVGEATMLAETLATCRCHFVRVDPQGAPRVPALINMLTDQVVDYCIPRSRIDEAKQHLLQTNSTDKVLRLQREAKDLFTKNNTTGEGGELLLYALLEIALGLPQILCKMPLKTNPQVHYHGVDGVHVRALGDGKLAVYWGEAKMYADVNAAIDAALKSLAPLLLDTGNGAAQRDVLLLRDHVDTGDEELTAALVRYFTEDTVEASQLVIRGACLVGFSMDQYSNPLEADGASVRAEVAEAMARWHDRLSTAITNEKLFAFELEVFLVPLPSVQDFRDQLLKRLGLTE